MNLGDYMEIAISVEKLSESVNFYKKLGYRLLMGMDNEYIISDGLVNICLREESFDFPVIEYYTRNIGDKLIEFQKTEIEYDLTKHADGGVNEIIFYSPENQKIIIKSMKYKEEYNIAEDSIVRFGRFGEYTIPVKDLEVSERFWERLGFIKIDGDLEKPYPWSILKDKYFTVGLHQTKDIKSTSFTYFTDDYESVSQWINKDSIPFEEKILMNDKEIGLMFRSPENFSILIFRQ